RATVAEGFTRGFRTERNDFLGVGVGVGVAWSDEARPRMTSVVSEKIRNIIQFLLQLFSKTLPIRATPNIFFRKYFQRFLVHPLTARDRAASIGVRAREVL